MERASGKIREMIATPPVKFIIGVNNICKHFNFGRDFFYECLRLGMPHAVFNNRYMVTVRKVEDWMEEQMESQPFSPEADIEKTPNKIKKLKNFGDLNGKQ